jgi:hypothetical protein
MGAAIRVERSSSSSSSVSSSTSSSDETSLESADGVEELSRDGDFGCIAGRCRTSCG